MNNNEIKILKLYYKKFINKKIIFSGNIQDNIYLYLQIQNVILHIKQYFITIFSKIFFHNNIYYGIIPDKNFCINCNVLIYFWIKNKLESKFQLHYLISILPLCSQIFIIGKNNIGINSINNIFKSFIQINKIDYKKKCSLYYGKIIRKTNFIFQKYCKTYTWNDIILYTLPGIFGYHGLDQGSLLLISTFNKNIKGKILDIGSGSGILSVALNKIAQKTQVTLVDNSSEALLCSKNTLRYNNIQGQVFFSDIYSHINNKFDLIISNPPTHFGKKNNFKKINNIIQNSIKYLNKNGKLRIVIHSNISCQKILNDTFHNYQILKKINHFTVYQSILK
ncbi:Ribosomal RNA small subunit methyltransferase C [Buchnera aphidicola (Phyllaphis fagi)]|uniref:16S rRNA (guanine(1207)-N(2))-methyltransferase RsmC n=1 Tax=Buchnera aphidicola TaxID=9 RepID=UPI00346466D9